MSSHVVLNMYIQECISVFMASMVLIIVHGGSEYVAHVCSKKTVQTLPKKNKGTFCTPHLRTCSELPSDISTLAWLAAK